MEMIGSKIHSCTWTVKEKIEKGKVIVSPVQKKFLQYQNAVKSGRGDISADIERARNLRVEEYLEAGAKKGKRGISKRYWPKFQTANRLQGMR